MYIVAGTNNINNAIKVYILRILILKFSLSSCMFSNCIAVIKEYINAPPYNHLV